VFRWWRRLPFNLDAGTRPSNLNAWFANAAPLLDSDIAVTNASTDRYARSRCTQFLLHRGPTQSSLHIRWALAGSESAAEPATATATAKMRAIRIHVLRSPPASQRAISHAVPEVSCGWRPQSIFREICWQANTYQQQELPLSVEAVMQPHDPPWRRRCARFGLARCARHCQTVWSRSWDSAAHQPPFRPRRRRRGLAIAPRGGPADGGA
jgi:hypothetical protein